MIAAAAAGPQPIHHEALNEQNLTEAIRFCLSSEARSAAATIAARMRKEDGVTTAVNSFQINLPVDKMCCDLLPDQIAVWQVKHKNKKTKKMATVKLSDEAAFVLVENKTIEAKHLQL
jgi:sterol 3beta-glucosyltransferase